MFRIRRLAEARADIKALTADNAYLARDRRDAWNLAQRRYELLQAAYRENEDLRARLGLSQRSALGETLPLPRVRSLRPGNDAPPAAPGPMCVSDAEFLMQPLPRRE